MRTKFHFLFVVLFLLTSLVQAAQAGVTFSITPFAVSNTYVGPITLQMGGLTNGETVVVQKFLDVNANGVVDAGDWLVQQFNLTDGHAGMVIGGVTNFNVPGDTDGTANGQITAALNFQNGDIGQNINGGYLYVLSSPVGHFAPITNSFSVTNFPFAQMITGHVLSNGVGAPVPNALVLLIPVAGGGPVAGTLANNAGGYTLMAPPGDYSPSALSGNYLGAFKSAAPVVTLGGGQTVTTNLTATAATAGISGGVVDATNANLGLPGLTITATCTNGLLAVGFTDTNGNFNLAAAPGIWKISANEPALSVHGYLGFQSTTPAAAGATGITLASPKATSLIYGRVTNALGNPLPALEMGDDDDNLYESFVYTDTNGNYVLGALGLGGNDYWWVQANYDSQLTNYVFPGQTINGNFNAGQAVLQNFTAILATNLITGSLTDNNGNPLPGVYIYDYATISDLFYVSSNGGITDANGNYVLNVCNGTWDVGVDYLPADESDRSLPGVYGDGAYLDPADQYPVIANHNAVVNFTATNTSATFICATNNDAITITGYTGPGGAVRIPGTINGLPVTDLGTDAFFNNNSLTSITIPNSVTSIEDGAFANCSSLTSVTLGNSVTNIGESAFGSCVVLSDLTMGDSVTTIGEYAFFEDNLTSVTIPASVTHIGDGAFGDCAGMTAINVDPNNPAYVSVAGVLFNQGQTMLLQYPPAKAGTAYAIPGSVTNISAAAFYACLNLSSVTIPGGVISIGDSAFFDCTRLATVNIPASVSNIGDYAFQYCIRLAGAYFAGNAPYDDGTIFDSDNNATVYYLPGTSGWNSTFGSVPAVMLNAPNPAGSLQVIIAPAGAFYAGAQWQVDGGVSQPGGATVLGLTVGSHTVSFSALSGWATPTNQTVTILANQVASASATYVNLQPYVTVQPAGQNIAMGGIVTFSVTGGGSGPLGYAWHQNGASIPAATNSSYSISNVPLTDSGSQFFCVISNAYGSVTSIVAVLTVGMPPGITGQPANQVITNGGAATFNAAVSGTGPFTYQWQLDGTNLPGDIIITVAGGYVGDGVLATNATLNQPEGVAVDASGNLFIADVANNLIREVSTNGVIATVAGNGNPGYAGDGGEATNASLGSPSGVAVDAMGNLFIADSGNSVIRQVNSQGVITTVAGGGYDYPGDGGAATNASLGSPSGVAVDASGNLFIADTYNQRIREVDTNGLITTVAGNGTNGFSGDGDAATNASLRYPEGIAVDGAGHLYIADGGNNRIREVGINGIITTLAGGGQDYPGDGGAATNAFLNNPECVAVDPAGNLFIADTYNIRIREVGTDGILQTVAGNGNDGNGGDGGPATDASLNYPYGVALAASGNLFIADTGNNRIREVGANGIINTIAGGYLGNDVTATSASLNRPTGVAVDGLGNQFIADSYDGLVREVSASGIISTVAGGGFDYPGDGGAATNASLGNPSGVGVDGSGDLFIADSGDDVIREVNSQGVITTAAGGGYDYPGDGGAATDASLNQPEGVAVDSAGDLFIADTYNQRICEVGTDGILITVAGNGNYGYAGDGREATNASLAYPAGVAVDASGNLFIADSGNNVIRKVDGNGDITTVAGDGNYGYFGDGGLATNAYLANPEGVSVDASGDLFIADYGNTVIREVSTNGLITTVAGNRVEAFAGDGGSATNASLSNPQDVTADRFGNLFIADTGNNRIREVTPGAPTLSLTMAGQNNEGTYDVVVTSPFGSVTSTVATLTVDVTPALNIIAPGFTATGFVLSGTGMTGANYAIEASTNLVDWVSLSTNPAPFEFTDVKATNYPTRFYRMVLIP